MGKKKLNQWQFWVDQGGTFTDILALSPTGEIVSEKLLTQSPFYSNALIEGIHRILQIPTGQILPYQLIDRVQIGTTIATNTLLEHTGSKVLLITNQGFGDFLKIGDQSRPDIFARHIVKHPVLFTAVAEIDARTNAQGNILRPVNHQIVFDTLSKYHQQGIESIAIVFIHAYKNPQQELEVKSIAQKIGFSFISTSAEVSNTINMVNRGQTTVLNAYLAPKMNDFLTGLNKKLIQIPLYFMQSHGGLCLSDYFIPKNAVLSGPSGGLIASSKICPNLGIGRVINIDMGGTSTDISLYNGSLNKIYEKEISGIHLKTPMLEISTIAAGGGSVLDYDGQRFTVGPHSAGAIPGPMCYQNHGPLTVTDCNLFLGRIVPDFFPPIFGKSGDQPLNRDLVVDALRRLQNNRLNWPLSEIAQGFLSVAIENISSAIRKMVLEKGDLLTNYDLCCYGGAAGQLICLIATELHIEKIIVPRFSSLFSALGIGLANVELVQEKSIELELTSHNLLTLDPFYCQVEQELCARMSKSEPTQHAPSIALKRIIHLKYIDSLTSFPHSYPQAIEQLIPSQHQSHFAMFGFQSDKPIWIDAISVEASVTKPLPPLAHCPPPGVNASLNQQATLYDLTTCHNNVPIIEFEHLSPRHPITGPAIIVDRQTTVVVDQNWLAQLDESGNLLLLSNPPTQTTNEAQKKPQYRQIAPVDTPINPALLEIYYRRLSFIAEHMGVVLQRNCRSTNIKERLDYSCALFDSCGSLIANAPHIPIHLGSMEDSVKSILAHFPSMQKQDAFILNSPFHGGTHLPDITIISPVFVEKTLRFFVASRAHHADIGGLSPGSMPANSRHIDDEGILIPPTKIVDRGIFREKALLDTLMNSRYPCRSPRQNIDDIKAQIAANQTGLRGLHALIDQKSLSEVLAYVQYMYQAARSYVEELIPNLIPSQTSILTDKFKLQVKITPALSKKQLTIDFRGSSKPLKSNFNTPKAVTKACIIYVIRTLIAKDIPLNGGCLEPIRILFPKQSILTPSYPSAVVAGNVEVSQTIVNALYIALSVQAASQGTMNNLSFGNQDFQYYETICGGSGAGAQFHGASAIQTHMTNSRLTDPEILESKFPILLRNFSIRYGSGGLGDYHGGDGSIRTFEFLMPLTVNLISNYRKKAPAGIGGGNPGTPGNNFLDRKMNKRVALLATAQFQAQIGDLLSIETPGGGGFGLHITSSDRTLCFAFGSNMDMGQMKSRCPSRFVLGRAYIDGYDIQFSSLSKLWKGGTADIFEKKGSTVWGVLYNISLDDLTVLDQYEGHYRRVEIMVNHQPNRLTKSWVYVVKKKKTGLKPSPNYLTTLLNAAVKFNFPLRYQKYLTSLSLAEKVKFEAARRK